ncbi:MAG: cupin domain-containing protein [Novosphingobium sp.]|uniref:cupin domain-containing protein n=1 Tax=Novosphingobium sp. TaxID=1874826 RepID=UPI002732CE96|nr:cupin domain-containing protein [Novosphingobium sp.]MDP3551446.1 cupin domain-containing protein [Novosphingobium sp.]
MLTAEDLIDKLGLSLHPEGGYYRETWRAQAAPHKRPASTAILFLLRTGDRSHWHTVDADEIWMWQSGDPVLLEIAEDDAASPVQRFLGPEIDAGQTLQGVVPTGQWQAAKAVDGPHGYALVSCVVAPGFDFAGFTLAPPEWNPGA